jgi:hypothetical protein
MRLGPATSLTATFLLSLTMPIAANAAGLYEAQRLCEDRIRDVYGVSKLRDVWAESAMAAAKPRSRTTATARSRRASATTRSAGRGSPSATAA